MKFFFSRVADNTTNNVIRSAVRPLSQAEVGVWIIAETNSILPGCRILLDSFRVHATVSSKNDLDALQNYLSAEDDGNIYFRSDVEAFYQYTTAEGFTVYDPVAPPYGSGDNGGGDPDPDPVNVLHVKGGAQNVQNLPTWKFSKLLVYINGVVQSEIVDWVPVLTSVDLSTVDVTDPDQQVYIVAKRNDETDVWVQAFNVAFSVPTGEITGGFKVAPNNVLADLTGAFAGVSPTWVQEPKTVQAVRATPAFLEHYSNASGQLRVSYQKPGGEPWKEKYINLSDLGARQFIQDWVPTNNNVPLQMFIYHPNGNIDTVYLVNGFTTNDQTQYETFVFDWLNGGLSIQRVNAL